MIFQLQNPTSTERKLAQEFMQLLAANQATFQFTSTDRVPIRFEYDNRVLTAPKRVFILFLEMLKCVSSGGSFYLLQTDVLITTQQAADILNMSRPHLVKLLENGDIPFKKVGTRRKILVSDIYHYGQKMKQFIPSLTGFSANSGISKELDL